MAEAGPLNSGRRVMPNATIFLVLLVRYFTKVGKSVVPSVSIDMIDSLRPDAIAIKPRQPVKMESFSVQTEFKIAVACRTSSDVSWLRPSSMFSHNDLPSKQARIRLIGKSLVKSFKRKIGFSHDAPVQRIGQRPGGVGSAFPASSF